MQVNDKLTLTLPNGKIQTGKVKAIYPPKPEPYIVVKFPDGQIYGFCESELKKNRRAVQTKWLEKYLMEPKLITMSAAKEYRLGFIFALYLVDRKAIEPINQEQYEFLFDFVCKLKLD